MKIISKYLIKEIETKFIMILSVVVFIYLIVDFVEKIDNFLEVDVPFALILQYFVYKIPFVFSQIIPLATLLAVLITFGLMSKHNELTVLRSSGVNVLALVRPVVRFGVGAAVCVILMAEVVTPLTVTRSNQIWFQRVKNHNIAISKQNDIWLKHNRVIIHLKYYNPKLRSAMGVSVHQFDNKFHLVQRIDAKNAIFNNQTWVLTNGIKQTYDPGSGQFSDQPFEKYETYIGFSPKDLAEASPQPEEMSFVQLYHYINNLTSEGYDAVYYKVALQAKLAVPFICILMTLVGMGIGTHGRTREGLPISITYGIGIAFLYFIAFSFCSSLGNAGMLPPLVAVWIVNFVALSLVTILILNID